MSYQSAPQLFNGSTVVLPNPGTVGSTVAPNRIQVKNASGWVIQVQAIDGSKFIDPFTAITVDIGIVDSFSIVGALNAYTNLTTGYVSAEWLLSTDNPTEPDGPLTAAATVSSVLSSINQQVLAKNVSIPLNTVIQSVSLGPLPNWVKSIGFFGYVNSPGPGAVTMISIHVGPDPTLLDPTTTVRLYYNSNAGAGQFAYNERFFDVYDNTINPYQIYCNYVTGVGFNIPPGSTLVGTFIAYGATADELRPSIAQPSFAYTANLNNNSNTPSFQQSLSPSFMIRHEEAISISGATGNVQVSLGDLYLGQTFFVASIPNGAYPVPAHIARLGFNVLSTGICTVNGSFTPVPLVP